MSRPTDLRLALGAAAAWLALLWGLTRAAMTVAIVAAVLLATVALVAVASRRHPALSGVAFAMASMVIVLAPLSARLHQVRDGQLARLARADSAVIAELRVTGDPRPLAARGTSSPPRSAIDATLLSIEVAGRRHSASGNVLMLVPTADWRTVLPGQRVRVAGRLSPPLSGDLLTAVISAYTGPQLLGRPPPWQRAAGAVRAGLQRACAGLPNLSRGLLPAVVDGDESQLDPVLANRFQVAGLTHLIAVSGTNCAIVVGTVALLLRRLRASPRTTALLGGLVLAGFVIIARPSPSVLRAAGMSAIALAALATGRPRSALPVLAAATLTLLVWQPSLAVNLGFALSVVATLALLLIAPGWAAGLRNFGVPAGLAEPVAVAAAAHLVTMPLIAGISGRVSLVAIPANVLAEPVIAAATLLGLVAAVCSVLWLPAAAGFAQLAGWPCRWLVWVAEYFGSLPGASVPWPSGVQGGLLLGLVAAGCWWLCRWPPARRLLALAVAVAVLVQIPIRAVVVGWPPTHWIIVACAVGQGDALAINAGPGSAIVVDAGPDPVAVDRCLRELGIQRIPLLVLTHSHLDHVAGLPGVLHQRQLARVITSPLAEPLAGHRLVLAALGARRLTLEQVSAGAVLIVGQIRLDVLGPIRLYRGTRSDPNNSSVVIRASVHGIRILLPGDAELEAQDDLLTAGVDLRADILKVPHHGSAYSDPAFLRAVHARLALITVGLDNDYGHPSPLLLAELARLGVPARRTDLDGDIAVVEDGSRLLPVIRGTAAGNAAARAPPDGGASMSARHDSMKG